MTDIIANAKQLLDGATPGPWEWSGYDLEQTTDVGGAMVMDVTCENPHFGGIVKVEITPEDERLIAAAPDFAQALAEETWEYSYHVQNTIGMWEHPTPWAGETGKWWETKEDAEESALAAHEYGYPIRIVRRRVSPVEVVNEAS